MISNKYYNKYLWILVFRDIDLKILVVWLWKDFRSSILKKYEPFSDNYTVHFWAKDYSILFMLNCSAPNNFCTFNFRSMSRRHRFKNPSRFVMKRFPKVHFETNTNPFRISTFHFWAKEPNYLPNSFYVKF